MSGDVAGRRGRIAIQEQFAGNVDEAQWGEDAKQQIPESGNSPGVEVMFPSLLYAATPFCKMTSQTWATLRASFVAIASRLFFNSDLIRKVSRVSFAI